MQGASSCPGSAVALSQGALASASHWNGQRGPGPGERAPSPSRHPAALRLCVTGSTRLRPPGRRCGRAVCQRRETQLLRCNAVTDRGEAEAEAEEPPVDSDTAHSRLTSAAEPRPAAGPDRLQVSIFGTSVSLATIVASAVLLSGVFAVFSGRTRAPSSSPALQPPPMVSSPAPASSPTRPDAGATAPLPSPVILGTYPGKTTTQEAWSAISATFPQAVEATAFLDSVSEQLAGHGIRRGNCIALVSTCRDEAPRLLDAAISERFGLIFNLHGLGGVPPGGVLAVQAGCSHSPVSADGRERYVFFALSHIGVDERGAVGSMRRVGQGAPSGACGALLFVTSELAAERSISREFPPSPETAELHFLRQRIEARRPAPDLVAVTQATVEVINEAVEGVIAQAVDPAKADYAVITGIQIHSGANVYGGPFSYENAAEFVVPSAGYVVVNGEKRPLKF